MDEFIREVQDLPGRLRRGRDARKPPPIRDYGVIRSETGPTTLFPKPRVAGSIPVGPTILDLPSSSRFRCSRRRRSRAAGRVDRLLGQASLGYGSPTSFQVGSGSYSLTAAASSAVASPRFFSYTRPC